jgi:predicted transcriptional regulator of viral defense system
MPSMADYLAHLEAEGRYHFTTEEAVEALGQSVARVRASLRRLKADGQIVDPHRSFHVILPPEHRDWGCPPAQDFVPPLMEYLDEPYYVALLSAAEAYGVTQGQRVFQVMAPQNHPSIDCGESRVQFSRRKDLARTPLVEKRTARGALHVASPEATALELVGYSDHCGGLARVASVVSDLAAVVEPHRLTSAALLSPIAWAQRLGYLLDLTDNRHVSNLLSPLVQELANDFAPLVRARPKGGATRLARWKLVVNASL